MFTDIKHVIPSIWAVCRQDDLSLLTSVSIISHTKDQPQQTLRFLPLLQQNLSIARQAQEQAKGNQRVRGDGGHGASHMASSMR